MLTEIQGMRIKTNSREDGDKLKQQGGDNWVHLLPKKKGTDKTNFKIILVLDDWNVCYVCSKMYRAYWLMLVRTSQFCLTLSPLRQRNNDRREGKS